MLKSCALSISNVGVIATVLLTVLVTESPASLIGILVVPLNLFVWQYTRRGIVISYEEGREIHVEFETQGVESDSSRDGCLAGDLVVVDSKTLDETVVCSH